MQISDEQARILRAVRDGRMRRGDKYRWMIDGDTPPDRRERERLHSRLMIDRPLGTQPICLLARGQQALDRWEADRR
jgi:hypothetical protein